MRRKRRTGRRLLRVAVALAVAAAVVGAALAALPRIVEGLLIGRLDAVGIPDPDLRVAALRWTRATITDLRLGTGSTLTADRVVLSYSPLDLLRGRIEAVHVQGVRLALHLGGDGPLLGDLEGPLAALGDRTGGDGGDLAALPELHVADGTLALETPVGRIAIPFAGRITSGPTGALDGGFTLLAENLEDPGLAARRIDGALDFAWPPGGLPRLSAHLRIADFAAAGAALRTASLDIALDGEDGTAELRLEESGDTAALYARASLQALPGAPEGTAEIDAHATAGSALWRVLDMPPPTQDRVELASTLAGKLSPAQGFFVLDQARMTLTGLAPAGIALDTVTIDGNIAGTPDDFTGTAVLAVDAPELLLGAVRARDVALKADAAFAVAKNRLTAQLRGGEVVARRLARPDLLAVEGPIRLPVAARDAPSLAIDFTESDGPRVAYDLLLGPTTLNARLRPAAPDPIPVELRLSALSLAGVWPPAEPLAVRLAADLAQRGAPALFAPIGLNADLRLANGRLTFTVDASAADRHATLKAKGHHDLRSSAGAADIDLGPIAFAPDGSQPKDLAPVLAGWIEQATGTLALAGTVSWTGIETDANLQLLLRDLSFMTPQAAISRLNAVVVFDDLLPLSTPPGQTLAVAAVDAGVPLTDGLAAFRVDPGGTVVIESGRLNLAGGTVSIEPAVIDLAATGQALRLRVSDVALGELAALAAIEGLSATGRLDGTIPLRFGEGFVIENGVLAADGPGRLRYDPAEPPAALQAQGETVSLLLSALTDFRYEELRLTVDRDAGGETIVAIHVEGNNPAFYDGYPVELNFNISGKLDQALHRGLAGYRVPNVIRERLSEFPD